MDPRPKRRQGGLVTGLDDVYDQRFSGGTSTIAPPEGHDLAGDRPVPRSSGSTRPRPSLDIACDPGYFIRNVHAVERWAADLRDVRAELPDDVHFVQANGLDLEAQRPGRRRSGPSS